MEYNIAVIKGDGIGPEIVGEAQKVLSKTGEKFGHKFNFTEVLMGGCAIDKTGEPLPKETVEICKKKRQRAAGCRRRPEMGYTAG